MSDEDVEGGELEEVVVTETPGGGGGGGGTGGGGGPAIPPGPINGGGGGYNSGIPGDTPELQQFEIDYKSRMSAYEIEICNNMNRVNQVTYLINAQSASSAAENLYPGNQHNTRADAFRHAYFSILNVSTIGFSLAESLGNAHEEVTGQPGIEKQMDLWNNNAGRNAFNGYIPNSGAPSYFANVIQNLVNNGNLKYIQPDTGNLVPTNQ